MRLFLIPLFSCSLALCSAADVSAIRIWPEFRTAESFERIGEFFTNSEVTGGETMLRTQPDSRAGFYFLTRVRNRGAALEGVQVELKLITAESVSVKTFNRFSPVSLRPGSQVLQIGLTGSDWVSEKAQPVAWQIRLLDAQGNEVLREASFLWGQAH